MDFKYTLENIGCLDKAELEIKPLTVIAGMNSSGKTFATKSLYATLSSLHDNHFMKIFEEYFKSIDYAVYRFQYNLARESKDDLELIGRVQSLIKSEKIQTILLDTYLEQIKTLKNLEPFVEEIKLLRDYIETFISKKKHLKKYQKCKNYLEELVKEVENLLDFFSNPNEHLANQLDKKISKRFKKTFQVTDFDNLKLNEKPIKIKFSNIGEMTVDKDSQIEFNFFHQGIDSVQNLSNVIFLDSPIFLKLQKALTKKDESLYDSWYARLLFGKKNEEDKYLSGVPKYVEYLYERVTKEYIDTPYFEEIRVKIKNIIKGDVLVENNNLLYETENGKKVPMNLSAMGITSLAIIYLLIKSNTLDKGSYLIIDEPEVHLHPAWQLLLMEILYNIAEQGANVVIATHSIEIIKYLEVFLKEKENAEDNIALNYLPTSKEFNKQSLNGKIDFVLDDLGKPFFKLFSRV